MTNWEQQKELIEATAAGLRIELGLQMESLDSEFVNIVNENFWELLTEIKAVSGEKIIIKENQNEHI
jgi:hypothetical protein